MLHFLSTARFRKVNREFFETWGHSIRNSTRLWTYEGFPLRSSVPPGTWIFTDLERLLPNELHYAAGLADHLAAFPESYRVLNHPRRWLNRFDLQRRLSEAGINDFRAWRLEDAGPQVRYPVLVRRDNDHRKSKGLFHNAQELKRHIDGLGFRDRWHRKHFMVVEFANVADSDGIFRKYSAMRIADQMIPRHILFSKNWLTKFPDLINEKTVAEESTFCASFPHAASLFDVFRLAGMDYGRVDYGVKDGRVCIWEINSMPVIVPQRDKMNPLRVAVQEESAKRIVKAFKQLAENSPRTVCTARIEAEQRRKWRWVQWFGKGYGRLRR